MSLRFKLLKFCDKIPGQVFVEKPGRKEIPILLKTALNRQRFLCFSFLSETQLPTYKKEERFYPRGIKTFFTLQK